MSGALISKESTYLKVFTEHVLLPDSWRRDVECYVFNFGAGIPAELPLIKNSIHSS